MWRNWYCWYNTPRYHFIDTVMTEILHQLRFYSKFYSLSHCLQVFDASQLVIAGFAPKVCGVNGWVTEILGWYPWKRRKRETCSTRPPIETNHISQKYPKQRNKHIQESFKILENSVHGQNPAQIVMFKRREVMGVSYLSFYWCRILSIISINTNTRMKIQTIYTYRTQT